MEVVDELVVIKRTERTNLKETATRFLHKIDGIYVKKLRCITMEFNEDVLSVIRGFARPLRPKEREAKLIKAHAKETRDKVIQKLNLMARADPFQGQEAYRRTTRMVENWTLYGVAQIAKQPPGWLRRPYYEPNTYVPYTLLYRDSLQ